MDTASDAVVTHMRLTGMLTVIITLSQMKVDLQTTMSIPMVTPPAHEEESPTPIQEEEATSYHEY